MTGGWEVAEDAKMLESAERIAAEAVEFCTAKPVEMGVKDLILTPSHAMLTIHEIVGARRPSSIASSATRPTTPAPASSSCPTSAS